MLNEDALGFAIVDTENVCQPVNPSRHALGPPIISGGSRRQVPRKVAKIQGDQ